MQTTASRACIMGLLFARFDLLSTHQSTFAARRNLSSSVTALLVLVLIHRMKGRRFRTRIHLVTMIRPPLSQLPVTLPVTLSLLERYG
eukprot:scaffold283165_cov36-Prasinocladus_malaysianus.AAC.1